MLPARFLMLPLPEGGSVVEAQPKRIVSPRSARRPLPNPNHHIWCNNGTYFIHVTLRLGGRRKLRLRKSLGTKDVGEARRRRDRFLACLQEQPGMELLVRPVRAT
jgi:hypothetical protein